MSLNLMGKKRGMTQLFDDKGNVIVCTIIEAEPNIITQIKTDETDGYAALQLGFEKIVTKDPRTQKKRTSKPLFGHYEKANVEPRRFLLESRLDKVEGYSVGQELGVEQFNEIKFVDAEAISKGKGYQGVMKLYHFAGGPASHGSGFHRHAGSRGMRSTPGRVFPNGKCATRMGYDRKTVQNLEVILVDKENNLILVKGAVPGPKNGLVKISPAIKMHGAKKKSHK